MKEELKNCIDRLDIIIFDANTLRTKLEQLMRVSPEESTETQSSTTPPIEDRDDQP